ncbi:MAG: FAD-binding oxidoreductase [Candidatus Rokubacteria bacterium]|nr:FAD-binding oxidoreductase [Candidatus Rokubacteria bacterium]
MLTCKVGLEREMGLSTRLLSGSEARELCPELSNTVIGADYCADEGSANPFLVTPAFAGAAKRAGAMILTHIEVSAIERDDRRGFVAQTLGGPIRAHRIVNAAGPWAASVAAMLGIDLPIRSRPIQVNVTEPSAPLLRQMLQHVRRRLTLKQTPVGTFLLGGGWPASASVRGGRNPTTWESMNANAWVAASVLPRLADLRIVRTWAGLIPITPRSMIPMVGEVPGAPGFYVLASGVGFTLGPILGRLLAESLAGRPTSHAIDDFGFARSGG